VSSTPVNDPAILTNSPLWTSASALDFTTPTVGATAAALDGNIAPNRTGISAAIAGAVVAPGQELFLRWLDLNDAGNDHGVALDDMTVTWTSVAPNNNPPSVTVQPQGVTNYDGGTALFTVGATGQSPLSYQWYFTNALVGTTLITDATNAAYSLATTTNDNGWVFVTITNGLGTTTSALAKLVVLPAVFTNIAYLRTLIDGNYNLTDTNTLYSVEGVVVSSINMVSGANTYSYFIEDTNSGKGIDVFHRAGFSVPGQGQLVRVTAQLLSFNGLLELNPISTVTSHRVDVVGAASLPVDNVINIASAATPSYMDALEGSLVVISNVYLGTTNTTFPIGASLSVTLSNGIGQTLTMFAGTYATNSLQGQAIPTYCSSVRGILSQNDNTSPYTSGYQLLLTSTTDLVSGTPPANTPIPLNQSFSGGQVTLTWNNAAFNLQSSTIVTGTYATVVGAVSPYVVPATNAQRYFRLLAP
jgi:hypothetical protein